MLDKQDTDKPSKIKVDAPDDIEGMIRVLLSVALHIGGPTAREVEKVVAFLRNIQKKNPGP